MTTEPKSAASTSKRMKIAGWIVAAPAVLLLLFSGVIKFVGPPDVAANFEELGWPVSLAIALGITEIAATILYLIPRTAVLGAILLTGYLGGAVATHLRIDQPFIIPAAVGVLLWLGLFFRDARIRALIPITR